MINCARMRNAVAQCQCFIAEGQSKTAMTKRPQSSRYTLGEMSALGWCGNCILSLLALVLGYAAKSCT